MTSRQKVLCRAIGLVLLALADGAKATGADDGQMVRLSKLVVVPSQLDAYESALAEEVKASVRLEPGVLTLYAVSEKDRPTHFTILEIYANKAAYLAHVKSPHFLKYKTGTAHMVESLELLDAIPLLSEMKIK